MRSIATLAAGTPGTRAKRRATSFIIRGQSSTQANIMDSKELRIGNWVEHLDGSAGKVNAVMPSVATVLFELVAERVRYAALKGIPLTPEILEKAGFFKVVDGRWKIENMTTYYYLSTARDYKEGFGAKIVFSDTGEDTGYAPFMAEPMYYLHQLQNLFFALTGEELEIEL